MAEAAAVLRTEWSVFHAWLGRIALVAVAAGLVGGLVGGVAVYVTTDPRDGWRDVAAFAAALVLGAAGALLAAVVGVVVLVLRFAPRGRRAPVLGWTVVVVGGVIVIGAVLARVSPDLAASFGDPTSITALAAAAAAVVVPVILLVVRERDRLRRAVADRRGRRGRGSPGSRVGSVSP